MFFRELEQATICFANLWKGKTSVLVLQQDRPVFFLFFNLQRQTVRVFSLLTIYHRIVGE